MRSICEWLKLFYKGKCLNKMLMKHKLPKPVYIDNKITQKLYLICSKLEEVWVRWWG